MHWGGPSSTETPGASLKLVQHGALGDGAGGTGLPSGCTLDGETLAPGLQSWFDAAAAKATGNLLLFVTWGAAGAARADASDGFALHDLDVGFDAAIDHALWEPGTSSLDVGYGLCIRKTLHEKMGGFSGVTAKKRPEANRCLQLAEFAEAAAAVGRGAHKVLGNFSK